MQIMTSEFELDDCVRKDIAKIILAEPNLIKAMRKIDQKFMQYRTPYPYRIFHKIYGLMIGSLITATIKQLEQQIIDKAEFDEEMDEILEFLKKSIQERTQD